MSDDSLTAEELFERASEKVRPIARRAREVILEELPEAVEVVRTGHNSVNYGPTAAYKDVVVYIIPHSKHVNLGFFQGVHLEDPDGLMEGTGKTLRHVKLKKVENVDTPAVRDLLRRAWNHSNT